MERFFAKVLVGSLISLLMVLASVWIAGACTVGLYQPEIPKK